MKFEKIDVRKLRQKRDRARCAVPLLKEYLRILRAKNDSRAPQLTNDLKDLEEIICNDFENLIEKSKE